MTTRPLRNRTRGAPPLTVGKPKFILGGLLDLLVGIALLAALALFSMTLRFVIGRLLM